MIAYRYCSNEELENLENNELKGYTYETNPTVSTHEYDEKEEYLHFYLDEMNMFCFDEVEPENLVQFRFPNEFDEFRGLGFYYCMDEDYNLQIRTSNQLAVPASLVKKEYIRNIEEIDTKEKYNDKVRRLINNHI